VGGGATAYEYAQIFSTFGARVHVIEQHTHLLHKEDTEVGDLAEAALTKLGVRVHTHAKITSISGQKKHKVVTFEQHGQQHRIACDTIMVASGKQPNTNVGLENTGVKFSADGIRVNAKMQSSKDHIYAAGDVTGGYLFTHVAAQHARIVTHNMFHNKKVTTQKHAIPRVFFGEPEVAAVGKTEHELKMNGHSYQTAIAPIGILGRASTANYDSGFVKVIATHSGVLIGASIVAPHAGEMLQELTFAVQYGRRACDISETIHPFPTWSEAIRIACNRIHCD
jgi:pyruvate/2-oxoglutarate dehydrogenase complex dihydrolipoamide dehydrogenase (E3) component